MRILLLILLILYIAKILAQETKELENSDAQDAESKEAELEQKQKALELQRQQEIALEQRKKAEQEREQLIYQKRLAQEAANKEAQKQAEEEAERQAKSEAEQQAKAEAEKQANEEAERQAKEEEERRAKEEAERQAKQEAEKKALEEARQKEQEKPILDPVYPVDPVEPISLCDYTNPIFCKRDRDCVWDVITNCANQYDCSKVPLLKCDATKPCHSTPSIAGYCSGPPAHCKPYNLFQCHKDPLCQWQVTTKCLPKDPQPAIPNCGGMSIFQCLGNSQFCNLNGQCFDNKNYCSALNYFQCIHDPACNYTFTQKEQCLDNPKFCLALNEKDCLKNSQYCNGVYTIPQCINQFNCNGLNEQQCNASSNFCHGVSTSYNCQPRQTNCSVYTSFDECRLAGCDSTYVNGQFVCQVSKLCSQLNEQDCKNNQNICFYTPSSFTCQNNFDCATIDDPNHCKLTKGCHLIPSVFKCLPKNKHCKYLQGGLCKKDPTCIYIPAKGFCSQDMDFGCQNLSLAQCQNNKHCSYKYTCSPKPVPNCNVLNVVDCKNSPFCQLVQKGNCYDKKFDCNLPQAQCLLTKPCVWHFGIQGKCVNDFNCNGLSGEECLKHSDTCNINSHGFCRHR